MSFKGPSGEVNEATLITLEVRNMSTHKAINISDNNRIKSQIKVNSSIQNKMPVLSWGVCRLHPSVYVCKFGCMFVSGI